MSTHFARSNDGRIHLTQGPSSEFTLCGNAFDGEKENDQYSWEPCARQPITCKDCARIILHCQNRALSFYIT